MHRRIADARAGQTLLLFTLALIPLLGALGLVVDIGWAYFRQESEQTAADAAASAAGVAALAAASGATPTCATTGVACYATPYTCPGTITPPAANNISAGCMYASSNGYATGGRQKVTFLSGVGTPPGGGAAVGYYAIATVSETIPQLFSAALGVPTATVFARATAGVTSGAPACIYALSPTASPAVSVTGASSITTTSCGVFINSSGAAALTVTGTSHVTSSTVKINGSGVYLAGSSTISPTPTLNAGPAIDPLASLVAPTFSGCNETNYSIGNGKSATLSPGVYCGGINIGGAANVTLNPGIYVLDGGGLIVSNGAKMTGAQVMFYNTATTGRTIAPVSITGNAVATLSAPNSGTYQGVAFFQDRTKTYVAPNSVSNSGTGTITGVFYFPTTEFDYTGNTAGALKAAMIANTIKIAGSSTLTNDSSGTYTGLALRPNSGAARAVLIE